MGMVLKICGMREAANLAAVAALAPNWLGLIFYRKSSRYLGDAATPTLLRGLPPGVRPVGVFVDAPLAEVQATAARFGLALVQLHGHESPAYCRRARAAKLLIIKAFAVDEAFDFAALAAYAPHCAYFLFDTKGPLPGGNGGPFDWRVLARYGGPTPFVLSGGLGPANVAQLLAFRHPQLAGFDFNSQLETAPGHKDVAATRHLLAHLRQAPGG